MSWHNGDYPTATSLGDSDIFLGAQSGASVVFTGTTLKDYISARSANILNVDSTLNGTDANTSQKTLYSYILPAATLSVDGHFLHLIAWGSTAGNSNTKRIQIATGTPFTLFNSSSGVVNGKEWWLEMFFIRLAAGNEDVYSKVICIENGGDWGSDNITGKSDKREATENTNSDITFNIQGQNGSAVASDVLYEGSIWLLNA